MADFSFSFDSDNPFAEPEVAPQAAFQLPPAADKVADAPDVLNGQSATAPAEEIAAPAPDDEISLDAFDFSFEEGPSINDSLPTQTMPVVAAPRQKTPGEAALADFDFGASDENDEDVASASPADANVAEMDVFEMDIAETNVAETNGANGDISQKEIIETENALEIAPEGAASVIEAEAPARDFGDTASKAVKRNSDLDEFNAINFETAPLPDEPELPDANGSAFLLDLENFDQEIEPIIDPIGDEISTGELPIATKISVPDASAVPTFFPTSPDGARVENEIASESDAGIEVETSVETPIQFLDETAVEAPIETSNEIPARPRRLKTSFSVAILGATGIGKNHARWFHHNNCRVVGFLGTSDDSTAQSAAELSADFPFDGTAYTDLGELLRREKPDIVCVATPPSLHFGHVLQSLEAGAHVLCEKPLVYAPTRKFRENRDGAKELVKVAAKKKLVLATQLQYGAATPILCKLAGLSPNDVGDFAMELETLNPNSSRDPRELWIDLGPHPISVAQMLAGPGAQLAEETIRFESVENDDKTEVLTRFGINCADGRLLMVRVAVRSLREATRQPRRRFSFNGHSVIYAPLDNGKGNYQAQFVAPDGYASVYADPVDYLIGDFVRACREGNAPLISGDFGRENLEWMLKVAGDK